MNVKYLLIFLSCIVYFNSSSKAQTGGPDAFGYMWTQYRAAGGAQWIDISNRPGTFDLTDRSKVLSLIGPINFSFDFPYYWYHHNTFYINRSGYVSFQPITLGAPYDNIPLVGGQGDDYIAPLLTVHTTTNDEAKLYLWTDFKDSIVVSWVNLAYRLPDGSAEGNNTFQMILGRRDSSITFQYIDHVGSYNNTVCPTLTPGSITNCQLIGIENVIGQGLRHSLNNENIFVGISKADPLAIRYVPSRVAQQNYSLASLAVAWNNNSQNGGMFVSQDGPQPTLQANIHNRGTTPSPTVTVRDSVMNGGTFISSNSITIGALEKEESRLVKFNNKIPTDNTGFYTFITNVLYPEDQYKRDNRKKQLVIVVDTTTAETNLDYSGGVSTNSISWTGNFVKRYQAGNGVYIEPPYYPAKITGITYGISAFGGNPKPVDSLRFQIFDNNGTNVLGLKDGSRGDLLFQTEVGPLDQQYGNNNLVEVPTDIQINSGGVYVSIMQSLPSTIRLNYRASDAVSYRTYEVNGLGGFNIYRDRANQDFVLGINVAKGDLNQVFDLKLDSLMQPRPTDFITDSVEVKVQIKNTGPQKVLGPFDVAYQVENRQEVLETVPGTVSIEVGQTYIYTFKQKAGRPFAPKTQYEQFCTRVVHPNDFLLTNDTLCYSTSVGISQRSDINGVLLFPNPSQGTIQIGYGLSSSSHAVLEVLDMSGRLIKREEFGLKKPGVYSHTIHLDADPGVYVYRLITDKGMYTDRLVLIK